MTAAIKTTEIFLIAMGIIFTVPYLIWRVLRTDYLAPLVVVQILTGVLLGPGILGKLFPAYYAYLFRPEVIAPLNGIAWWAGMLFVWVTGIELDLKKAWSHRSESGTAAALALGVPLLLGSAAALGLLQFPGWLGARASPWQFVLGVGIGCAVTALPVLVLLLDKLEILRTPMGQRLLRYASLDDVAIWCVLAVILMDWSRVGRQVSFLLLFAVASWGFRRVMQALGARDRWYAALIWVLACSWAAEWAGLHFMVGAFLSGAVLDAEWFEPAEMDRFRRYVLLGFMPVFFLSTGLRTNWDLGGSAVLLAALVLLAAAIGGKLLGTAIAGRILGWAADEAAIIGWLLQTKGLVMIVFINVLLDTGLISSEIFTALLLMAVASTMLTVPMVAGRLRRARDLIFKAA
ncbi:MAG: cation:proton antiporter [Gammaproteobacteria bacterium]|nr:cation:proton antiporter [Gammaproteobacteria bacterium]